MTGTFWALVPALLAIALALITKEVYSSLFCGIVLGDTLIVTSDNIDFRTNELMILEESPFKNIIISFFISSIFAKSTSKQQ